MYSLNQRQHASDPNPGDAVRKSAVRLNNAALVASLADIGKRVARSSGDGTIYQEIAACVGETLKASRAVVVETVQDPQGTFMTIRAEWLAADAPETAVREFQRMGLSMEAFGLDYWKQQFRMEQAVTGLSVEVPFQERRYLDTFGIRSFAAVPLIFEGIWWGFIEVDDAESYRLWDKAALSYLDGSAALTASVLKMLAQQARIEAEQTELSENRLVARALAREVDEVRKWKNAVFSSFSHEFQTPLYTLLGFSATLLENASLDDDPEIRRTCLQHIYEQANRLDKLVKEMMDLSALQAREVQPSFAVTDLQPLLETIAGEYRLKAEKQGVSLYLETDGMPLPLPCDAGRIRTMLTHLLDYSLASTPSSGWISLRATGDENSVSLVVSDSGAGIDEEHAGRIFEPFYGLQNGPRSVSSTGLGLSIAKDIVDLHRGFITVESGLEEGTAFHVTLPRRMF